jgi:alkanesulfonate monooxygenase SsuD/methylene tetrahydromethanopterin reductase-like flavin-dependent oxidoreductase (luciferase family)
MELGDGLAVATTWPPEQLDQDRAFIARGRKIALESPPVVVIAQPEAQEHAEALLVELFIENNFGHGVNLTERALQLVLLPTHPSLALTFYM